MGNFDAQIKEIENQIRNVESALKQKGEELALAEKEESALLDEIRKFEEDIGTKKNEIRNLEREIIRKRGLGNASKTKISKLKSEVDLEQRRVEEFKRKLEEAERSLKS